MITVETESLFVALPDESAASDGDLFEAGDHLADTASEHETEKTETNGDIKTSVSSEKIDDMVTLYLGDVRQHDVEPALVALLKQTGILADQMDGAEQIMGERVSQFLQLFPRPFPVRLRRPRCIGLLRAADAGPNPFR